jgi:hypothetical protein
MLNTINAADARDWMRLGEARRRFNLSETVILRAACLGRVQFTVVGGVIFFRPEELGALRPRRSRKAG